MMKNNPVMAILEMIEAVDPGDTEQLDRIDNAVYAYVHNIINIIGEFPNFWPPLYTRSRDALKTIRPKEWQVNIVNSWGARCEPIKTIFHVHEWMHNFKTEELAELHSIIQAIEFDRNQENEN